ncbi:hypothetical protein D9M68_19630 [compost metagenome]
MIYGTIKLHDFLEAEKPTWEGDPLQSISKSIIEYYRDWADPKKSDDPDSLRWTSRDRLAHCMWMLSEIINNDSLSITRKHRWFGFVQAVLIEFGIITIAQFRDLTRNVFNGD